MGDPATLVGRLRVRATGPDPDTGRIAARRLATAELRPAGLPRGAILCVRHLVDPAPGSLVIEGIDPATAGPWQRAVERRLDDLARSAARPADGPVPPAAEAVLFRDRAELLACLAEDRVASVASLRWWWTALARDVPEPVSAALRRELPLVPGVVAVLDRRGSLATVFATVEPARAAELATGLLAHVGREAAAALVQRLTRAARSATPPAEPEVRGLWDAARPAGLAAGTRVAAEAWALAVVALGLAEAPATVRSAARAADAARRAEDRRGRPTARPARTEPLPEPAIRDARRRPAGQARPAPAPVGPSVGTRPTIEVPAGTARRAGRAAVDPTTALPAPAPASRPHPAAVPDEPREAAPPPWPVPDGRTETGLGGLFFLLPVALHLDLYADFTRPLDRPLDLDPWDLLALLGTALGAASPEDTADPVWTLLAALAGRPAGVRPGADWDPPAWSVRAAWLDAFPGPEAWTWSSARDRVRVAHPAGFAVLDRRAKATTPAAVRALLRREVTGLRRVPPLRRARTPRPSARTARARWIAELARYLDARLRLALGLGPDADLAASLLRRPAEVEVTVDAVTVTMALDAHPVEIRLAGLDRDLGWVPAARRALAFRFV